MAEEILVTGTRVIFTGIFSVSEYYKLLYDLFRGLSYEVEETAYDHKAGKDSEELVFEWTCTKKVDDYTALKIAVKTKMEKVEQVQVQVGNTVGMKNKGVCTLDLKGRISTDYENRWETNPWLKFFKGIYDVYIYKSTFETWKGRIAMDLHTVENEVKAFFNMQRFM